MADSDEDQDKSRSRDKFRRERSDYSSGGDRNRSSYREKRPWRDDSDSYANRRRSRDDYEGENRKRFSGGYGRGERDWSPPPAKRMRPRDWTPGFPVPGMMMPYGMRPPWPMPPATHQIPHGLPVGSAMGDSPRSNKHSMLSFKQFLTQQEDDIDEAEAITSYNNYKEEFKKKMIEEFFEEHKEEDWLISKYHPKRVKENKEREAQNRKCRVMAFSFLLESGQLDKVSLTADNTDAITKIMDSAVIKMEGGSDTDLLSLEGTPPDSDPGEVTKAPSFLTMENSEESQQLAEQAKEYRQKNEGEKSASLDGSPQSQDKKIKESAADEIKEEGNSPGSTESRPSENGLGATTPSKPRALHVTRSVYIRHIPAKISADDIIQVCRTIPGFLRIAFADPAPDKGYERRGWATFTGETDIKEVISRLSVKKIQDCQLNCQQNRELSRRVKQCTAAVWAKKALHSDLQQLLKLIKFFDERAGLWEHAAPSEEGGEPQANPVLSFPQELLEEEPVAMATGADEEEGAISDPGTEIVDKADERLKVLDRLLWYIRIVHSLDYYTGAVFPSEDSMPHRCGLFTIRSQPPDALDHKEVSEYVEAMEEKVKPLLVKKENLSETEVLKLGKKDPEAEVERFVEKNTQKLAENKYLCPLSGKKFKGPEFVRKHIFNKHVDKVEDFKQEAEFFNNYISDPDRPMPEESAVSSSVLPSNPKTPGSAESPSGGGVLGSGGAPWDQGAMGMYGRGGGFGPAMGGGFTPPDMMNRGGFRGRGVRRGRSRKVVNYQDLDAPEEMY